MKFTYYCKPGKFLSPRAHYVFIGEWIRPEGYIVLQHGNMSYLEYKRITEQGFIRILESRASDYTYIEPLITRADMRKYHAEKSIKVGILIRKDYNLYIGRVCLYGRVIL